MSNRLILYTIGHSDHTQEELIALLQANGVTTLVDVRSAPYSRWVPQFNKPAIEPLVVAAGIRYDFQGDRIGGRPSDPALYDSGVVEGRPNYEAVAATPMFIAAIEALLGRAPTETIALMCSEGDFRQCHRSLLITPALLERGAQVIHIEPDGSTVEATIPPKQLSLL